MCVQTVRRSIYKARRPEHPLHGPVTCNPARTRPYGTATATDTDTDTDTVYHDHRKHCAAASRAHPLLHQVLNASAIIGVGSSMLAAVYDWIRLTCFDLIRLTRFLI